MRVGIVGGLGPESTIDYYRRILEVWREADRSTTPSIVIDSLDVQLGLRLVEKDRPGLVEYLLESLRRLAAAGADFAAMAANTPHIVFDELAAQSPIPLVSIVEACAEEARRRGLKRLALLGTRFTMEGSFYPTVCERYGIAIVTPNQQERLWLHERYVGQLLKGEFREDTRQQVVSLIERLRDEHQIDGIILGGTELTILLPAPVIANVPALDTTALHVAAIVKRLRPVVVEKKKSKAPEIAVEALTSPAAATLIAALNAELSAMYPEPGANHFSLDPSEVAPGAGIFVVARVDGQPVGCGAMRRLRESSLVRELGPRVGELKRMYVAPEVRGNGIGRALLIRLEAEARTLALTQLVLETGTRQTEALALYRRAGFTPIPPYGEYAASADTSVCMSKTF